MSTVPTHRFIQFADGTHTKSSVTYSKTTGNKDTHRELRWGLLVVIEVINYEWVELIFVNYLLIASTLSSCYHCVCDCVHVCQTIWVRGWVGGDFNWYTSCRWSKWGSFYCELQKTRWLCRALTGCLNDAGMSDTERIWMKFPSKWITGLLDRTHTNWTGCGQTQHRITLHLQCQ